VFGDAAGTSRPSPSMSLRERARAATSAAIRAGRLDHDHLWVANDHCHHPHCVPRRWNL
jgi:hypothetical protein